MAARDHAKTLRQRNEKARREGFRSYAEKRKVLSTVNHDEEFLAYFPDGARGSDRETLRMAHVYYRAFHTKEQYDYSTRSPKAEWFVKVADLMDYDEWAERYPLGVREYAPVGMAA